MSSWTCFMVPAGGATPWGPITGQVLWVKGLAVLLQCKFCLLPISPLWLVSFLFFQAHHFMFLNLKFKVCLVSKISANPWEFFPKHIKMFICLYLALWRVIQSFASYLKARIMGKYWEKLLPFSHRDFAVKESSQFFKRNEENPRDKVSCLPLVPFYSPRIHTLLSNPVAAVLESCLTILPLPAPHQPVALVLIRVLPVLPFLLYFCDKEGK